MVEEKESQNEKVFKVVLTLAALFAISSAAYGISVATAGPPAAKNFVSPLNSGEEVPPVVSNATGLAKYQLSKDGKSISYKLIVANISDVIAAHIHCGAAGVAGPAGVGLHSGLVADPDGILAQGTITGANPGNRCGWDSASLDDVLAALRSGDTYTNVHTLVNKPGEIRGQIKVAGPK